jgi:hypothetical protein
VEPPDRLVAGHGAAAVALVDEESFGTAALPIETHAVVTDITGFEAAVVRLKIRESALALTLEILSLSLSRVGMPEYLYPRRIAQT